MLRLSILACFYCIGVSTAFKQWHYPSSTIPRAAVPFFCGDYQCSHQRRSSRATTHFVTSTTLHEMKRPILDRLASFVFKLETDRVANSSVPDMKGRSGEPMEWAESDSLANRLSQMISSNDIGYWFKQTVADIVAGGDYNKEERANCIREFVASAPVTMYSFTTCPFCRKAKDYLDEQSIPYVSIELDLLLGNEGNEIRAELGRITRRTSVPSIFIGGERMVV